MFAINLLRSITFIGGAAYLIFTQNHSLVLGVNVLLYLATALSIGGLAMLLIPTIKTSMQNLLVPSIAALMVLIFALNSWFGGVTADTRSFSLFNVLVAVLIGSLAATEIAQSFIDSDEDVLELRISGAIGAVATLVFIFAPLDIINALGILSAYLALSAIQRAVWMATAQSKSA
jgi:hypothetical protein